MKILRTYVVKEFARPFFLSVVSLTLVMLLGNIAQMVNLIITKGVFIGLIGRLFLTMIPYLLSYTLPVGLLCGCLLALGRLSADNEILSIRSSGIHPFRLVFPLLILGLIASLASIILNDRLIPYSHYQLRRTLIEIGFKNPTAALEEGTFIRTFEKYVLYIYRIDPLDHKMYNIRIYEPQGKDKPTRTIIAKEAEFISMPEKGIVKLKLMDGSSDEPDLNNPGTFYKLRFRQYFMNLNLVKDNQGKTIEKKPKDMNFQELLSEAKRLNALGVDSAPLFTEIHRKIAISFSCFIFMLLGSGLGIITHQRAKSINLGLVFLVVMSYYLLFMGAEALSLKGILHPNFAMWLPNIILGAAGVFFLIKVCVL